MDQYVLAAADNSARWCDRMCRSHGVMTRFDRDAWVAVRRSPAGYPDAVTLAPAARPADLLRRVDRSPGCSIKDSDASLDLSDAGFEVLFDAEWIYREPPDTGVLPGWSIVWSPDELFDWGIAHGGGPVFRPDLIADGDLVIVAGRDEDGTVVAGAIGNRSQHVVGVSNVFTTVDPDWAWAGALAAIADRFPGYPLVGYESGDALALAHRAGFVSLGPLRVWLRH